MKFHLKIFRKWPAPLNRKAQMMREHDYECAGLDAAKAGARYHVEKLCPGMKINGISFAPGNTMIAYVSDR
jgi:hypothetical protein